MMLFKIFGSLLLGATLHAETYSADLKSDTGISEVLYSLDQRHPALLRNFFADPSRKASEVFRDAYTVALTLGEAARGFAEVAPHPLLGIGRNRGLTLEEVPKPMALLREGLAPDKRLAKTILYALHKNVRVFWIRRGDHAETQPLGYIVLLEVSLEGKIVPYILTITADLSPTDRRTAILVAAAEYGAKQMLLPANEYASLGDGIRIQLPQGWDVLDQISGENPYNAKNLRQAKQIKFTSEIENLFNESRSPEAGPMVGYEIIPYASLDALQLASVFASADLAPKPQVERKALMALLGIKQKQGRAALTQGQSIPRELTVPGKQIPILGPTEFALIKGTFGLSPIQVMEHWPLLNVVEQMRALTNEQREEIFRGTDLHAFMDQLRERLQVRSEEAISWEKAILDRYYFLRVPNLGDCREALQPQKAAVTDE